MWCFAIAVINEKCQGFFIALVVWIYKFAFLLHIIIKTSQTTWSKDFYYIWLGCIGFLTKFYYYMKRS